MSRNLDEIQRLINQVDTADGLKAVNRMIKARWSLIQTKQLVEKSADLAPGTKVRFPGRYGAMVEGVVVKLAQKNVVVRASDGVRWRVAPGLLESVNDKEQS
jgi:hypothetical protein